MATAKAQRQLHRRPTNLSKAHIMGLPHVPTGRERMEACDGGAAGRRKKIRKASMLAYLYSNVLLIQERCPGSRQARWQQQLSR